MNYNKKLHHMSLLTLSQLLHKWHSCLRGNVAKDLHLCKGSSKVEGQDELLVCSLQYLHNEFALWILGQIYARLQELNYHQLHKYSDLVENNPVQKRLKLKTPLQSDHISADPSESHIFLGTQRIEVRKRHNPVKIPCATHISWCKFYEIQ